MRPLPLLLTLFLVACSLKPSESKESNAVEQASPATPTPAVPTTAAKSIAAQPEPSDQTPQPQPPPDLDSVTMLKKSLDNPGPVLGDVQHLAKLKTGFIALLHDVQVSGNYAYVLDASGMIHRVPNSGGEFEVVHDSGQGSGVHAGFPTNAGGKIYFPTTPFEEIGELKVVTGANAVTVAPAADVLTMTGDQEHLFATYFKKNDIHKLGEDGFALFTKAHKPDTMVISGEYLYWSSYQRGTIHRITLNGKKKTKLAKARKVTGLAVVGDTLYYGTEINDAIHAMPTRGGKSKKIAEGFINTDRFISDDTGVYFWTWGSPAAVLRLDIETQKVEAMAYGLQYTRGLALQDGWLYIAGGSNLVRMKTDTRMPWPMASKEKEAWEKKVQAQKPR